MPPVAKSLNAHGARLDSETETLLPMTGGGFDVAHTLRGEGFDASEDGTGRGTPIVPVAYRTAGDGAVYEEGDKTAPLTTATDKNANIIAIQERAVSENMDAGPGGAGFRTDGAAYTLEARTVTQAVAFQSKGKADGNAEEADASSVLSTLRAAVGAEAFQQWGLGILAAFQSPEVLRDWMLGASLRSAPQEEKPEMDDCALPRAEDSAAGRVLRTVWEEGPDGRSSQGRGLAKQLAGKPGKGLSVLPHEGTQTEGDVHLVRKAREGARLLRKALSATQEVGRSAGCEGQPTHTTWAVRRLTPMEAERLQGFPDDYTRISWRGKDASECHDGPRYKALGNSMAINVMRWIGRRIEMVEQITESIDNVEAA